MNGILKPFTLLVSLHYKTFWILNGDTAYTAVNYTGYVEFHPEPPCHFIISSEVSWEDAGRGPERTGIALHPSPASWFTSIPPVALKELHFPANCTTHNQFNSRKPTANCRVSLARNLS